MKNIEADFVVVASGRNSKLNEWLVDLGYEAAEESYVNAHVGYASRLYSIPAGGRLTGRRSFCRLHHLSACVAG